jgi:hypothetical protein
MNDNGTDSGPNGYNGTISGAPGYKTGLFGNTLAFTSDSTYITAPVAAKICDLSDITINAWYYQTGNPTSQYHTIYSEKLVSTGVPGMFLLVNGDNANKGKISIFYRNDSATSVILSSTEVLTQNQWHFITLRITANDIELLIDGVKDATVSGTRPTGTYSIDNVVMGRDARENGQYFDATAIVDDIQTFTRPLTDVEIMSLYQNIQPSTSSSPSLSPSPSPPGGDESIFTDLIKFFVKASDGYTYGFGDGGNIYKRFASYGVWKKVFKEDKGITGATEMPSSTGKTYLGWCTDVMVKKKEIPGALDWSDVITVASNLLPDVPHTMKQVGGATKIANGSFLAMVGYDESYTNEAVDLIPGSTISTLVERKGRVVAGTVNAAIDSEYPLAQAGDDGDLYFADMNESVPMKTFPGGGKVNAGGVCNMANEFSFFEWEETALSWIDKQTIGNISLWAVYNADEGKGGVYSYGRKNKNAPFTLNLEYALDADELGALVNDNGTIIVSYKIGSSYGVRIVDVNTKATAIYDGLDLKAPVKQPADITKWSRVEVFGKPLPTGTELEVWYRINKVGDYVQAVMADGNSVFRTPNAKKAVFQVVGDGDIFEPRVILRPSGNVTPETYRVRVHFS